MLVLAGDGIARSVPLAEVRWPERTRHGIRIAHFAGGGSVQGGDASAWDAWRLGEGMREPVVVRLQQSWRWVLASVVALAVVAVALQRWGVPALSAGVVASTPLAVDAALGEGTLRAIDARLMQPSRLPAPRQEKLRTAFQEAVGNLPAGTVPVWNLVFRKSRIGPNAFALPGGTLVMTDELVDLVDGDEEVLVAVLAHELGHIRHRDGLRMLVQTAALGALASMVVGDFSTLLAGVPVLLGQASYSRQAEHAADVEAVRILRAARISPRVMVKLFDRLAAAAALPAPREADKAGETGQDSWLGIAFASHPADAERIRYFSEAAQ
ncbi:MAG: Zn-dependent protease [Polaromonas sp.]|nr:Zn-dependent protease [Polaromonas sp.]